MSEKKKSPWLPPLPMQREPAPASTSETSGPVATETLDQSDFYQLALEQLQKQTKYQRNISGILTFFFIMSLIVLAVQACSILLS